MKRYLRFGLMLAALLTFARPGYAQQTLTWTPNGVTAGGSGTWNTSGTVWANGVVCCFNVEQRGVSDE